jgi:ubiquinol-cytochrome c reductase cytochrome b subunit
VIRRALDWLEERTGYRHLVAAALEEPVPGGASWVYVFGSVLTFILINQLVTGVLLAFFYSPSSQTAWASVAYIQDQVTMGWFIRGLHAHGASAMVIVAGLHLLQVAIYGAYKKPREVNWIVGVLMIGLVLAFALTGYLLPWDQKGYWATQVATGIMGSTPLVGEWLKEAVQGGNEYGNLTLSRFYALHALVLPGALLGLVAIHLALFRKHGVTPRWGRSPDELARKAQPFWPDQLAYDSLAMLLAFAAMVAYTLATGGAELGAPADPASGYDARPEWYFLPLFQMLKYFHGPLEQVVALGLPAVILGILLALPFVDRGPDRAPRRRLAFLVPVFFLFAGAGLLVGLAVRDDRADAQLQKRLHAAEAQARKARRLALEGVPPPGGTAVYENEPFYREKRLFAERCAGCHVGDERKGPEIVAGYNSRAWINDYLLDPDGERFFGPTKGIHEMKPTKFRGRDLQAIVELVYQQTGAPDADAALAAEGRQRFDDGPCSDCHSIVAGEDEGNTGPNLADRGSLQYLTDFIEDPSEVRFFGKLNEMPAFQKKLRPDEISGLAAYVLSLRDASADASGPAPAEH